MKTKSSGLYLLLSTYSLIARAENWSTAFAPEETGGTTGWSEVLFSANYIIRISCALVAISLFLACANRASSGDYFSATLSFAGAILIALAPTLII